MAEKIIVTISQKPKIIAKQVEFLPDGNAIPENVLIGKTFYGFGKEKQIGSFDLNLEVFKLVDKINVTINGGELASEKEYNSAIKDFEHKAKIILGE